MSEALAKYRRFRETLVRVRWIHRGLESQEEDDLLEKMDGVWSRLSADEQAEVSAEPVRSILREGRPHVRNIGDENVWDYRGLPPRRKEVA